MLLTIRNYSVILDKDDFITIKMVKKWSITKNLCGQVYFSYSKNRKNIYLHKLIMNCPKGLVVDHINGNTLDNRKLNLRICTKLENQYNQKKHKGNRHSKYKGVTFRKDLKSKPWESFIYNNYKSTRLGYFASEQEAAIAYNEAAKRVYGQFAKLNQT